GGAPIDASGVLPGGKKFSGPADLRTVLLDRKDDFLHCFAEKLLTYALGRGPIRSDKCVMDQICGATAADGYRFSTLVREIVRSDAFQKRRGPKGDDQP
ncbi:MAG: DUF1585 domain-containing protein, partial [Planctomycetia bacterium]